MQDIKIEVYGLKSCFKIYFTGLFDIYMYQIYIKYASLQNYKPIKNTVFHHLILKLNDM